MFFSNNKFYCSQVGNCKQRQLVGAVVLELTASWVQSAKTPADNLKLSYDYYKMFKGKIRDTYQKYFILVNNNTISIEWLRIWNMITNI